ncbi:MULTISPECIES: DUF6152 family protein [unclassified Sphingobium]|uniref:DUF6152 family protein n=1 Tax=unclassified Sphingobium TaxID=2611147 RepID=UPI000D159780|nr:MULTISPECIES: DUF6152 family protein [unclassified Sphingobium]MBG6120535.1 hypothetical protein [Sphingobium sp. JAI105]PSO10264.1 hypothetical protein C7E20_18340 [Sphingobium sp. AEW4]TWD00627.1 hypothetical protein FB595_11959 [Sphingobium sp. AEW010]TWD19686.1 hypothetical protein FB596_11910 [Sphingobium sp. AEW013]TWD22271.1 hypothetical protein FB594_11910 [Sphingobium sp. AEW001]
MKLKSAIALAGLTAASAASGPASAHHSFAMFDQTKTVVLQGLVTKFEWTNPHAFVILELPVNGKKVTYTLECSSPALMRHAGWKFNTVKAGDRVRVAMHPLKDGKSGGMLAKIKVPDGRLLAAW